MWPVTPCGSRKVSTVVAGKDMNKFQLAYSNLVRGNIELKKKEKKADAKATKGGGGEGQKKPAAKKAPKRSTPPPTSTRSSCNAISSTPSPPTT
jgi:hypothetical protein